MLPNTDNADRTNNRVMLDHSIDRVTGEKSLLTCLWTLVDFDIRCDIDVNRNGAANVVVDGITVVVSIAFVGISKLLLFKNSVANVVTSMVACNKCNCCSAQIGKLLNINVELRRRKRKRKSFNYVWVVVW